MFDWIGCDAGRQFQIGWLRALGRAGRGQDAGAWRRCHAFDGVHRCAPETLLCALKITLLGVEARRGEGMPIRGL